MVPPKYKFTVCADIPDIILISGVGINADGEFIQDDSTTFSYGLANLEDIKSFYFDINFTDSYSAVVFYDEYEVFISRISLKDNNFVNVPKGAKKYGLTFTERDEEFERKKDTVFIYSAYNVNPSYKNLSKKVSKESQQEFFRSTLEGKITLFGKDYELISNTNLERLFIFFVHKLNKHQQWKEYYKGSFNKADCKIDYSRKSCEIKIATLDNYNTILDKYSNTYDLIKLAPEISKINITKRPLIQIYILGGTSISNFFGGTYWEDDIDEAIDDDNKLINTYHFTEIGAGNEVYVNGGRLLTDEGRGVYAGTNINLLDQTGKYSLYLDTDIPNTLAYIYLKRLTDNTILYRSSKQWLYREGYRYLNREDVEMISMTDERDTFIIENPFLYRIFKRILCDVDSFIWNNETVNTYALSTDDFVYDNLNYRRSVGFGGGTFYCTAKSTDEPTKYGINDYNKYFTNQFIPGTAGAIRPLPICRSTWANASLWYKYQDNYIDFEKNLRKQYTLKDSYSIAAVIKALLKQIDPTIKHEATEEYSRFLYSEIMPISSMERFYVYITQKTNILKGDYDQAAQKAETSLEDIMKMLRDCFKCYWFIKNGKFCIEHITYFLNGETYPNDIINNENTEETNIQFDFMALTDMFNKKPTSYFQSEIEYDKTGLNQRYEFDWMDDVTDLFGGITIDVKSNYIQKDKIEEITINNFSSDIDFMLFNPSNFSEDGFALLCPINNNDKLELPIINANLIDENGQGYEAIIQNYYASWVNLIQLYMYDMPAINITCNALASLSVKGISKCMEHTIEFPCEEDLDTNKLIKTDFGNGSITELSINLDTRLTTIKLVYEPK